MRAFVDDDEIERVKKNLETAPTISEALGEDWINNNILNKEERSEKHVMFWMFLDESKCKKMEDWLSTLKTTLSGAKFLKVVNSLKEKKREKEFYSFVPEIEVLSYYKKQENDSFKVEFEPDIPGKTKVGDVKLYFDSTQVFLEITRLFSSKEEEEINRIIQATSGKINAIEDNPFVITFGITESFSEADIEPLVDLVHQKIIEQRDAFAGESFTADFGEKAWFKFLKKLENKKGYVGGTIFSVITIKSAGRLKNKVLDEVEQLPENQFNVIVLDISHYFSDFDDVEDAFAGQVAVKIDIKTMEATPFRHANGIMQMGRGKKVGVIIAFKGFDYEHRKKYVNLSAERPFTDDIMSKI
jgi:hypothetical protein